MTDFRNGRGSLGGTSANGYAHSDTEPTESFAEPIRDELLKLAQAYVGRDKNVTVSASKPKNGALTLNLDLSGSTLPRKDHQKTIKAIYDKVMAANVSADNAKIGESTFTINVDDKRKSVSFLSDAVRKAVIEKGVERINEAKAETREEAAALLPEPLAEVVLKAIDREVNPRDLTPLERLASGTMQDWVNDHGRRR